MTSSPSPSKENQCSDVVTDAANLWKNKVISCEHVDDDDEEADIDFNPFLKEAPSLEASVSISSEIEEFDADVVDSGENYPAVVNVRNAPDELQDDTAGNVDLGQQTVTQSNIATVTTTDATVGSDDEDAIWRRTRARYSLVGSTLDELETFLQETDDEDDMHHNIDDQEEYRKFLAAVLQDGDSNSKGAQDHEIIDDDEDNDADFELELEEALGSDVDENLQPQEHEHEHVGRRPETRQKKRQKTNHRQDKFSGKTNRPLRPLVPYAPIAPYANPVVPYPPNSYMIQTTSYAKNDYISAFTPHQIGQLHCLMYEHVQLLVQVFSLSVLEPSRHHIATQVHKLLSEMLHKRDQIVASQRVSYPPFCFNTQYIQSTVNLSENSNMNGSFWAPFVSNNVLSVIDVAPLNLVRTYMDDVSIAVREYQKRQLEVAYDAAVNKECLFPFDSSVEPITADTTTINQKSKSKKTIAAGLVERSKKQSIALVPKEIAKLALRFFPLFNPALFPHKPPPVSVANRVLFTDSEDGLLARGIMKFNTDWKEIQKNYLPCKTPHQIFVRQKNRACSKAPENPIKAVRRMKTSPLTHQEKARIEEGLKIYKLDWMAVWQYMVPHRDPSLLPRQWRTAVGSQKSYKGDEQTKARRRIYESKRRKSKLEGSTLLQSENRQGWSPEEDANALPSFPRCRTMSDKENCSTGNVGENNSGDDGENNEDEAYVHEAFFSDWRPNSGENQPVELFTQNRIVNTQFPAKIIRSSRQVKLAPDLPPVNLPPTVRVMSQSAFTKYQDEACNKVRQNVGLPLSQPRIGQLDEWKSVTCNTAVEKSDSDLQMHPLLFQDPEDGRSLPYYPLNGSAGSSSSFDFFPNNPPQLNLNLFRHSQQAKHTLNFFNNSLKSKESSGVDFHPLLQRTDDGNGGTPLIQRIVADSVPPHQTVVPPSPNELDLDIGLSSNARKARVENGRDPDSGGGSTGVRNDEIVMEQEELSDSEDEEIAESVEFECEEMTDSEGESGSDSGHVENMQNEDVEDDSDEDEARLQETWKSDEPTSLFGLSLNPKLAVRRNSRTLKNTTSSSQPQLEAAKKPRKRADPK